MTFTAEPTQRVNATTAGDQSVPSISSLPGGGYAVVWTSADGSGQDSVYSQVYDAQGAKVGGETLLFASAGQFGVAAGGVATLPDGSFVVAADTRHSDGATIFDDVYALRVSADGQPQGAAFLVASRASNGADRMTAGDIYPAPGGGFYVGLVQFFHPTPVPGWATELQRYDASGTAVGAPFDVAGGSPNSSISILPNGNIAAAWDVWGGPAGPAVQWQVLDPSGQVISQAREHESSFSADLDPSIVGLANGETVVVWHHEPDTSSFAPPNPAPAGTYIVIADASGQVTAAPHLLDVPAAPDLVALADGGFLADWAVSDASGNIAYFAQEFAAAAQPLGDAFQIVPAHAASAASPIPGIAAAPDIAATPDGGFVVTFDAAQTGEDVFVQKFDPSGPTATGSGGVEPVRGDGPDTLIGTNGNDTLFGGPGDDQLDGSTGVDTAVYIGGRGQYSLSHTGTGFIVSGPEGTDTLVNIERLQFGDAHVALDIAGNAGVTALLLGAVFGPASVSNQQFVGIGLNLLDHAMSWEALMNLALNARLGAAHTNQEVVDLLYTNVVGSPPSEGARAAFVAMLDSGAQTQASLGIFAAATPLNADHVDLVGLAQHGLEFQPVG